MKTARVSRIGVFATLTMALLFGSLITPVAQADEGLDARRIMQAVNQRYQSFFDDPRQVDIRETVTSSSLETANTTSANNHVVHLKGNQARWETVDSDTVQEAFRDRAEVDVPDSRRLVWVHSDQQTRAIHESGFLEKQADGSRQPIVESFVIDHDALPESMPNKFRNPLTHLEFDELFLNSAFRAYPSVLNGDAVYVLQSLQDLQANANSVIRNCTFWIDAQDLMLVKMRMDIQQTEPESPYQESVYLSIEQDIETNFDIELPDGIFDLALPKNHNDLTDMVHERLKANGYN